MAEDRLARVMREDAMKSLAAAKLQLAQADFDILELQVAPILASLLISEVDGNVWLLSEMLLTVLAASDGAGSSRQCFFGDNMVCVAAEPLVSRYTILQFIWLQLMTSRIVSDAGGAAQREDAQQDAALHAHEHAERIAERPQ